MAIIKYVLFFNSSYNKFKTCLNIRKTYDYNPVIKMRCELSLENKMIDAKKIKIYNRIMRRWTPLILMDLENGKTFNEIKNSLKINQTTLSEYLSTLENYGIIERIIIPSKPVRVKYQLTNNGRKLLDIINGIYNILGGIK